MPIVAYDETSSLNIYKTLIFAIIFVARVASLAKNFPGPQKRLVKFLDAFGVLKAYF
jgi:hypothetical protein